MKYSSFTLSRPANFALRFTLALLAILAIGPVGLVAGILNPDGFGTALLGTSYTRINASTKSDIITQNAKNSEELWVRGIIGDSSTMFQINPFADGMSGGLGSGKAVLNIKDTTKVHGNTVNIPTRGGLAGPGVAGDGDRIGGEQKFQSNSFGVQIGRFWFGYGYTGVARDETMIGTYQDQMASEDLRQQVAKKKSDDILMKLIQKAGVSGRNYMLPDGVASRAALVNTNVMSTALVTKINSRIQSNGGVPMKITKDDSGSESSKYVILSPTDGLRALKNESAYLTAVQNGDVRGDMNAAFKGNFKDWDGTGLYSWQHINHGNWGPVGSPLLPRAYLGYDLDVSGTTTNLVVKGGGSNAAADTTPTPHYFEFFSSSPYTFTHGETIAAVTGTNRYIKVTNPDGTSAVLKYLLNDGTKITLPVSSVQTVSGSTATSLVAGALIEECNVLGWTFCRHIGLAQQAVVTGAGSIAGANGASGRRTEEVRNHGNELAVGVEYSWGVEAFKRSDGTFPGFIVLETAMPSAA